MARGHEVHYLLQHNNGVSSVTATFGHHPRSDLASVDIQNRVNTAQDVSPTRSSNRITVAKTSQNFVFGAGVFSPDGRFSTLFMSNYLDVYVRDTLKRVPGVADVLVFGERKYSMRLWLDPVRMASRSLTATMWLARSGNRTLKSPPGKLVPSLRCPARISDQRARRRPSFRNHSIR